MQPGNVVGEVKKRFVMFALSRAIAALAILPVFALIALQFAAAEERDNRARTGSAVLGFDMWCMEVEALSEARCDMRRPEDVRAYREYRAMMERYREERDAELRKERELFERLNRDPTNRVREGVGSAP
jgi:hypothetical protein